MPRPKHRATAHRKYHREEIKQVTTGVSLTNPRFGTFHRQNINWRVLETAWRDLESDILPEWIANNPFTRPVGWWLFDAKEPRLPVVGEQRLEALEWTRSHRDFRQHFFLGINRRLGLTDDSYYGESAFESEKQYLIRIGALTEAEKSLL